VTSGDTQYRHPEPPPVANVYDILIATIPHRHAKLCGLLAELDQQWQPGLGVIVYQDNLEHAIGDKRQKLLEASSAAYVSFADDDDEVSPFFVARLMGALSAGPDYVGFKANYWVDGELIMQAEHSLRYSGWHNWPDKIVRDFSHLNPLRREMALLGNFGTGTNEEDHDWASGVRASGQVREEEWIPEVMYHYRFSEADCHRTKRDPMPSGDIRRLPVYPWLVTL
jgi:hypothetical protein